MGFINRAYYKSGSILKIRTNDFIQRLPLSGKTLGNYLLDDCRHAIAHIRRKPGRAKLDIDRASERRRLALSSHVIKAFAEHYINARLGLKKTLFLVYRKRGEIPIYVDPLADESRSYRLVPRITRSLNLFQ